MLAWQVGPIVFPLVKDNFINKFWLESIVFSKVGGSGIIIAVSCNLTLHHKVFAQRGSFIMSWWEAFFYCIMTRERDSFIASQPEGLFYYVMMRGAFLLCHNQRGSFITSQNSLYALTGQTSTQNWQECMRSLSSTYTGMVEWTHTLSCGNFHYNIFRWTKPPKAMFWNWV